MSPKIRPGHALREMFRGLVEQVFITDLGVCDPRLTDYLSTLLVDFVHVDQIHRMRTVDGRVIREISRLQAEASLGPDVHETDRTRLINRYIGDFTLFWSGVYPEQLRRSRSGVDRLYEYLLQGKRSYNIAGELSSERETPPGELLRQLADQFEFCVHGLHLVRTEWEQVVTPRDN